MSNLVRLAVAFGAGALVMYLLDPVTGRRRRAFAQAEFAGLAPGTVDRLRRTSAEARAQVASAGRGDERLQARVRSRVSQMVGRPGDVGVDVDNGLVVLSGHVRVSELDALIEAVAAIAGVEEVESQLTTHVGPAEAAGGELPRH
ncbi:BON domain-containing protein [Lysobacter niabensis]|uniref:BON domain-containing protein n=1 Tax=Agrilutibacter niabensis TaxID=380628 RepID=UPI0036245150